MCARPRHRREPLARGSSAGLIRFYHLDGLGSLVKTTDAGGNVEASPELRLLRAAADRTLERVCVHVTEPDSDLGAVLLGRGTTIRTSAAF